MKRLRGRMTQSLRQVNEHLYRMNSGAAFWRLGMYDATAGKGPVHISGAEAVVRADAVGGGHLSHRVLKKNGDGADVPMRMHGKGRCCHHVAVAQQDRTRARFFMPLMA